MLRVVLALPRLPYPAVSGGELRVATLIERLAARARLEVYCFAERGHELKQAAAVLQAERAWGVKLVCVPRTPGFQGPPELPSLASSFTEPAMSAALREAAGRGPGLVHLEFSQMAQYAADVAPLAPVLVTEHDAGIFSPATSYERPDPAGAARAAEQARLAREHLFDAYRRCDRVVTVSEGDARTLRAMDASLRVECVPTGVDVRRFSFRPLVGRTPGTVAFLGHYPHYPNEEAALRLCNEVLPLLRGRVPEARARLIGSFPTEAVRALAGPHVEVTGTLSDVRPPLADSRVFMAPMRLGRGIKGKILEAFALGTPVVATPLAVEALEGARDGEHLLLGEGPEDLALAAERLLRDDALSARLAAAGRAYAEQRFDWDDQARRLLALYDRVAAERGLALKA